jgi:hypothetical protein
MIHSADRSTISGFVAGLTVAVAGTILVSHSPEPNLFLQNLLDGLAGVPVLIVRRLGAPLPVYYACYFFYSGMTGAMVARLVRRHARFSK